MSVIATAIVQRRPMRGYDDPGLPERIWQGRGIVVGDATGGNRTVRFTLSERTERRGTSWSLERVYLQDATEADQLAMIIPRGLDRFQGVDASVITRGVLVEMKFLANSIGVNPGQVLEQHTRPGIYYGMAQGLTISPGVDVLIVNVNANAFLAVLEGYEWGPRATLAANGLRRPVDGLYRV